MTGNLSGERKGEARLFSARLRPYRSLSPRNFRLLMALFTGASFISALPFCFAGAWPVAGFFGLNAAGFYLAFRANDRAARAYEDVELTFFELLLAKVSPRGKRTEWHFNPSFVRLDEEKHEEFGTQHLTLKSRGRSVEIGAFLGPAQKSDLAARLSRALAQARQGPRYS